MTSQAELWPWFWVMIPAGFILGGFYFGGLWLTVRAAVNSSRPGLLTAVSLLVRLAVLLGALYLLGGDDWRRLLALLGGILLARLVLTRRLGPARGWRARGPGGGESW